MTFFKIERLNSSIVAQYKKAVSSEGQAIQKPAKQARVQVQSGGFWDFVANKRGVISTSHNEDELNAYLAEPCISHNSDPLDYWRCHEEQYPVLNTLARKYLCMQCISVPSERLFSTAGMIISERRSRILPGKAEKILFLNKNVDI